MTTDVRLISGITVAVEYTMGGTRWREWPEIETIYHKGRPVSIETISRHEGYEPEFIKDGIELQIHFDIEARDEDHNWNRADQKYDILTTEN